MAPCFHFSLRPLNYVADHTHSIFLYSIFDYYYFMWVFCLLICLCITCVSAACRGQESVFYPLELELQTGVSSGRGARKSQCFNCETLAPAQHPVLISGSFMFTKCVIIWWFGPLSNIVETIQQILKRCLLNGTLTIKGSVILSECG